MTDHDPFLSAILASPQDDAPRLIYADWLEERGDAARAEFIRVQCELARYDVAATCKEPEDCYYINKCNHGCGMDERDRRCEPLRRRERELEEAHGLAWLPPPLMRIESETAGRPCAYKRGFVASVRLSLAAWCGRECVNCAGEKQVWWAVTNSGEFNKMLPCRYCRGSGRIDALGPRIVAAAPVERVEFTDREPLLLVFDGVEEWRWFSFDRPNQPEDVGFLWDTLEGGSQNAILGVSKAWSTHDAALYALSAAALAWARGMLSLEG